MIAVYNDKYSLLVFQRFELKSAHSKSLVYPPTALWKKVSLKEFAVCVQIIVKKPDIVLPKLDRESFATLILVHLYLQFVCRSLELFSVPFKDLFQTQEQMLKGECCAVKEKLLDLKG